MIKANPEVVHYQELRDTLSQEARHVHGTLTKAKAAGSKIFQKAEASLRCIKAKLRKSAKASSRQQFFDIVETKDINEQLNQSRLNLSLLDLEKEDWKPEMAEHQLDERKRVAELMCKENPDPTKEAKCHRRILTINALLALCHKREPPCRQKPDRTWATKAEDDPPRPPSFPVTW